MDDGIAKGDILYIYRCDKLAWCCYDQSNDPSGHKTDPD